MSRFDADLVVLKSNERKRKARITAVPELEWHVKGRLWEGVARRTDMRGALLSHGPSTSAKLGQSGRSD